MPLLLISGYPASGKTTISQRITEYFKMRGLQAENIEVISEEIDVNYTRSIHKDFKKVPYFSRLNKKIHFS
jgi:tRNA uridine 5-carbamoylmethylation protein Kti12